MSTVTHAETIEYFREADWAVGCELGDPLSIEDCSRLLRIEMGFALRSGDAVLEGYQSALLDPEKLDQIASFVDYIESLHEGARMLGITMREALCLGAVAA